MPIWRLAINRAKQEPTRATIKVRKAEPFASQDREKTNGRLVCRLLTLWP